MSYNLTGSAFGGNLSLTKAGLTAATTSTYSTTAALAYTQKGEFKASFAVKTAQPTPTTDAATGKAFVPLSPNESALFAFFVDSAGNVAVAQSKKVSTLDFSGGLAALEFPQLGDGFTPFGYIVGQASAALVGTWTFGTNNWAGVTGFTAGSGHDVMDYPAQPITAP